MSGTQALMTATSAMALANYMKSFGVLANPVNDLSSGRMQEDMRLSLLDEAAINERWHLGKDGTKFWASGEMMLLQSSYGAHQGFVKIVRDPD